MTFREAFAHVAAMRSGLLRNQLFIQHINEHFGLNDKLVELAKERSDRTDGRSLIEPDLTTGPSAAHTAPRSPTVHRPPSTASVAPQRSRRAGKAQTDWQVRAAMLTNGAATFGSLSSYWCSRNSEGCFRQSRWGLHVQNLYDRLGVAILNRNRHDPFAWCEARMTQFHNSIL